MMCAINTGGSIYGATYRRGTTQKSPKRLPATFTYQQVSHGVKWLQILYIYTKQLEGILLS